MANGHVKLDQAVGMNFVQKHESLHTFLLSYRYHYKLAPKSGAVFGISAIQKSGEYDPLPTVPSKQQLAQKYNFSDIFRTFKSGAEPTKLYFLVVY